MASIRRHGLPTSSRASPLILHTVSMNCYRGTGGSRLCAIRKPLKSNTAFSKAEKARVTGACERLIDDFLKPRFLHRSNRPSSTILSTFSANGTGPSIAHSTLPFRLPRQSGGRVRLHPSRVSIGSAATASTFSGIATLAMVPRISRPDSRQGHRNSQVRPNPATRID